MEINKYLPHGFVAGLKTESGCGSTGGAVTVPVSDGHPSPSRCGCSQLPRVPRAGPGFHVSCLAWGAGEVTSPLEAASDSLRRGTTAWPLVAKKEDNPTELPVGSGWSYSSAESLCPSLLLHPNRCPAPFSCEFACKKSLAQETLCWVRLLGTPTGSIL